MSATSTEFLEECRHEGVVAFQKLIHRMEQAGLTKLVLTDHPDYEFTLGIAKTNGTAGAIGFTFELITNFRERCSAFLQVDAGDQACFVDTMTRWTWIRDCWLAAGGRDSGRTVVLFANGIGDAMDLNTGEEPDEAIGFNLLA